MIESILISGGTGSFGRALVSYLLSLKRPPRRIAIYSRDEMKQHAMARDFRADANSPLRFFIGDVRDADRLRLAMRGIEHVVHAAALKIVPIAEYNPVEVVRTNIDGAVNVVQASLDTPSVRKVIALSTDKAVNPINLYGATKLAAEKILVAANNLSGTHGPQFSVVRYGNVAGSRGSVLPFFRALKGQSLPITDPRMTRFWIEMHQAIDLVVSAFEMQRGGEIFVPKIPSVRIMDLARCFSDQHHLVGIRPGEKIHETLVTEDEARFTVDLGGCFVISPLDPGLWTEHTRVFDGFRYSSDTNSQWLEGDALKRAVE
jgi:UDP-N-acetylglucosamine 4,6-dehydratase/5-epimerase